MEFRSARYSERGEVLDLLALWYQDRNFFARYNETDPAFRDDLCLVAVDGRRIVGTLQIFSRGVKIGGQAIALGGVGSVYTLDKMRRRGIGSALLKLAIEKMEQEKFHVSMLFSDRLDFYSRFGWRSARRLFSVIAGLPNREAASELFSIDLFAAGRDLAEVRALHRSYSGRFEPAAIRDESLWRANLIYAGNPGEHFVVARDAGGSGAPNGRIAAYARSIRFYGFPMVMEFGYREDAANAMLALFNYVSAAASGTGGIEAPCGGAAIIAPPSRTEGSTALLTHSAHDPEIESLLRTAGAAVSHHEDIFYMWRVINARGFAQRIGIDLPETDAFLDKTVNSKNSLFWTSDRF